MRLEKPPLSKFLVIPVQKVVNFRAALTRRGNKTWWGGKQKGGDI